MLRLAEGEYDAVTELLEEIALSAFAAKLAEIVVNAKLAVGAYDAVIPKLAVGT